MKISGKVALDRRMAGLCVQCGRRPPKPDAKTGFPALECQTCEDAEKREAAARAKTEK